MADTKRRTKRRPTASITTRWVRGSLLFTLAVLLVAEGVFLFFMINGYYGSVRQAITNQFYTLRGQMTLPESATADEKYLRLMNTVEQFEAKSQFEFMLIRSNGTVATSSSGVAPVLQKTPQDITDALKSGVDTGEYIGDNGNGEKVMAVTVTAPISSGGIVAMRLVTSLGLVDRAISEMVMVSVVVFAAIILASVISGVFFIRSIVIPLQKVESSAARIAEGDFGIRIVNSSDDEIGSLCATINHMAEELSRSERMKNEFISSVSHELRTPLTSIKGWAETLGSVPDPQDPNFRRGLSIIAGETDRLYDMVEELLDFSRMQNGLSLQTELLDLAAEVEDAVLLCAQRAAGLGVALLYTAPELPVPVRADKNRLRQVLVNVLDNAIKYSFTGGQVAVEITQEEDGVCVFVADEGQGIEREDLENVKLKFYKGRGALRGSGIGLAVVDEIMQAHGGSLQLESEINRGTTVCLRFGDNKEGEK